MCEDRARLAYSAFELAVTYGSVTDIHEAVRRLLRAAGSDKKQKAYWTTCMMYDAIHSDATVLKAILNAMSASTIQLSGKGLYPMWALLDLGKKRHVMAVVKRLRRDSMTLDSGTLSWLIHSKLILDDEVVDAVVGLLPRYNASTGFDFLSGALSVRARSTARGERALDLWWKLIPPMKDLVGKEGNHRLRFVRTAMHFDLELVHKLHDMLPLLPDGSCRRAEVSDYEDAIDDVSGVESLSPTEVSSIKYLVEQGGSEVLDSCDPELVHLMITPEDVEWLVTLAPDLLVAACKRSTCLSRMKRPEKKEMIRCLAEQMVQLVPREVIVEMFQAANVSEWSDPYNPEQGWRWMLKALHEAVPECMDGLRFRWLMGAVRAKEYRDVEFMLGMCTPQHLTERNEEGDRAYDVAARDERFPKELLLRLRKAPAKGAHA